MAKATTQEEETIFEEEVLRVCRALFAKDRPYQGSTYLDIRERDGIFVGEEAIILVEATVSRGTLKAEKDGTKLKQGCQAFTKSDPYKAVKGYFVTKDEPTADQRGAIKRLNANVVALSFAQLRALLIDSREYLDLRKNYAFGSARNPESGSATNLDEYIPIGLLEAGTKTNTVLSVETISSMVVAGSVVLITGDFGAGKSMTLREIHQRLAGEHLAKRSLRFPVTINLRDHQGQKDPDEALRRHAAKVGFDSPTRLVRAWRAGEIDLLLDGFDEIATTGWLGQANNLRQIRRRSVELVRRFVEETPTHCGVVLAGRRHLFDTKDEMLSALGLAGRKPIILSTDDFSDPQIHKYLGQRGWSAALPTWLPARPLLLGYLAASGVMQAMTSAGEEVNSDAAAGWNMLLDRICERESTMEVGVDADQVRRVLERLATIARTRGDGIGPIHQIDFSTAFQQVCGYTPDEGSYVLLQRMPGLGIVDPGDGSRHFIDSTLADVARAGDLVRFVQFPDTESQFQETKGTAVSMGPMGLGVAAYTSASNSLTGSQAVAAAERLNKRGASDGLVLDATRLALALDAKTWPSLTFAGLQLDSLSFADAEADLSTLYFDNCVIDILDLTEYDGDSDLPIFSRTLFGVVLGVGGAGALPAGHFLDCEFGQFDSSSMTTRGILATVGLSPRQRVLLTVLKKIYLQRGSGRRYSALVRGLSEQMRAFVPEVTDFVVANGLATTGRVGSNSLYYAIRGQTARVRQMVEQSVSSTDAALKAFS